MFVRVEEGKYVNLDRVVYIRVVPCKTASGRVSDYSFEFGVGEPMGYVVSKRYKISKEVADNVVKYLLEQNGRPDRRIVDLDAVVQGIVRRIESCKGFVRADKLAVHSS